jgi:SAM-dependent methyltransferase
MSDANPYRIQWDHYAKNWDQNVNSGDPSSRLAWPGDEWIGSDKESWQKIFQAMFLDHGATQWKHCVEIGAGSGKYTELLLRNSEAQIVTYDISPVFLDVLKKRLADDVHAGRVHPVILDATDASEILADLRKRALIRKIDAFYSIDAMVHVDLQHLVVYLMTAALCLRKGGRLMMSLANAVSEEGFDLLIKDAKSCYSLQGMPSSKFEWLCPEIVLGVLERLGFSVQFMSPFSRSVAEERDLWVVATLDDFRRAAGFRTKL